MTSTHCHLSKTQAGGFLADAFADAPAGKALLDTLSKRKYGAQVKQQGGWEFVQEMIKVDNWFPIIGLPAICVMILRL